MATKNSRAISSFFSFLSFFLLPEEVVHKGDRLKALQQTAKKLLIQQADTQLGVAAVKKAGHRLEKELPGGARTQLAGNRVKKVQRTEPCAAQTRTRAHTKKKPSKISIFSLSLFIKGGRGGDWEKKKGWMFCVPPPSSASF
jgi:hypothetical protein